MKRSFPESSEEELFDVFKRDSSPNEDDEILEQLKETYSKKYVQYQIENKKEFEYTPGEPDFVLALDGGGIRVILEMIILKIILNKFPNFLERVIVYCGCSASSFLSVALSLNFSIDDIIYLAKHLFKTTFQKKQTFFEKVGSLLYASYSNEYLSEFCETFFHGVHIKDLPHKICIPTYYNGNKESTEKDEREAGTIIYSNLQEEDETVTAHDACLSSSAAPSYFPPYNNHIDGGVVDNTGIRVGLFEMMYGKYHIDPKDIRMLSISSGRKKDFVVEYFKSFDGTLFVVKSTIDTCMNGPNDLTIEEAKKLLKERFMRIDIDLETDIPLDDVNKVDELEEIAENYDFSKVFEWIKTVWLK